MRVLKFYVENEMYEIDRFQNVRSIDIIQNV